MCSFHSHLSRQYNYIGTHKCGNIFIYIYICICRSQWPHVLRSRFVATPLLRSLVRNPPGARTFVFCMCCVLSGRVICDEAITCPEESYRFWCFVFVIYKSQEWSSLGRSAPRINIYIYIYMCVKVYMYIIIYWCVCVY